MTKFETNQTYTARSICDYDCVIEITIAKRTAKTITLTNDERTNQLALGKQFRITERQDVEQIKPWGSYSMAPVVSAV